MSPRRIQRRRTRGWRMPAGAVNVSRPSDWSNPFRIGDPFAIDTPRADGRRSGEITREIAVLLFRIYVSGRFEDQIRAELAGKDLACWCPLDQPCHADVLLEIANGGSS